MKQQVPSAVISSFEQRDIILQPGDTVNVYQRIIEGGKQRIQMFRGLVINIRRAGSVNASFTLRRVASGVGVEKTYLLNSPLIERIQIVRRGHVRRKYLGYIRQKSGKSTKLTAQDIRKGILTDEVIEISQEEPAQQTSVEEEKPEAPADSAPQSSPVSDKKPKKSSKD